jgi:molecular chaperone DnaK
MGYWLGIDVGTSFIAAAICRQRPDGHADLEVVPLGIRSDLVRSVIYLASGGELIVGEAAERRAGADPGRVVRGFVGSVDHDTPIVVDGIRYSASQLTAAVVRWVVDRVAQREGGPARGISVTHPVSWDDSTIQAMEDDLSAVGLPDVNFCAGPQVAAMSYAIRERIGVGATIAIYDLGGGVFNAAVVRTAGTSTPDTAAALPSTALLGVPQTICLGGTDFDDAVFGHVLAAVPALSEWEPGAAARLRRGFALCRRECIEAKETLSVDTEVTIPVLLPQLQSEVKLTRVEFEDLIRPQITETVEALQRTLASAGVTPADLDLVLLIGGSSRIPLVAELLTAELGRPVVVDPEPHAAVALGAALYAMPAGTAGIDGVTAALDVSPAHPAAVPDGTSGSPEFQNPESQNPEFQNPEPAEQEPAQYLPTEHEPPWLAAATREVDSPDAPWRRATSERLTRFVAAGLFAVVLAGGAVSAPFIMIAHRSVDSPPAGMPPKILPGSVAVAPHPPPAQSPAIERPPLPAPAVPVATAAAIPPPNAVSGNNRSLGNGGAPSAVSTTPPAPTRPLNSTARAKAPAPVPHTQRSKAPTATTPPAAPPVPDWVQQARS